MSPCPWRGNYYSHRFGKIGHLGPFPIGSVGGPFPWALHKGQLSYMQDWILLFHFWYFLRSLVCVSVYSLLVGFISLYFSFSVLFLAEEEYEALLQRVPRFGWICQECNYISKNRNAVLRHIKVKHFDIKDVPCTLCNMKFATEYNRKRHYENKHHLKLAQTEIAELAAAKFGDQV